jgi:signal transduction histidine kinase
MLKKFLILVSFLLLGMSAALKAEESVLDNLHRKLKNAAYHEKVEIFNQLSRYYLSSDAEKAIYYANQALKVAQSVDDKKGEAKAYGNLGMGYYFLSDYDELLEYYKKSLSTYKSIGDQEGVRVLATTLYRLDNFQKSLEKFKRSLLLYISEDNTEMIVATYEDIGNVYKNLGDYAIALENYRKALDIIHREKEIEQNIDQSSLWQNIGDIYFYQEEYDKALEYFLLLYDELEIRKDSLGIAEVLNRMASTFYLKNDLERAKQLFNEALALQIKLNDHYGASISFLNLAKISNDNKNYQQAIAHYKKSIKLAKVISNNDVLRTNYQELSLLYKKLNNYPRAYEYHVLYADISDFLTQEQSAEEFKNTLVYQDLEQEKQEKNILQAKNENYRLRLEKENLSKWRMSFGFTILVVLILVFIIYYRYYLKREENRNLELRIKEALHKQEEQQQIIVHQASLSSLGELAAGIAHEINQPIQNISLSAEGIKFELNEENPDQRFLRQSVGEIFEDIVRVREIVDHIRVFSSGQKESVYERFSVSDCVSSAVSMISRQYQNHNIHLNLLLHQQVPDVIGNPHKVEQVIYNLLSNARDAVEDRFFKDDKHHKEITLKTGVDKNEVFIEVRDNGIGIPREKKTDIFLPFVTSKQLGKGTGLGLSISYSLVNEMNGRIEIKSRVMEGTVMKVIFPMAQ